MFESCVCDEKVWGHILSFNSSIFLNRVKRNLENDLEIFLYLKFRFHSFVFSNLYIQFFHIFVFVKENATIRNQQKTIVNFVLKFIHNCLIVMLLFKMLLLMSEILCLSIINFLKKLHFFLLMFALIMHFFIDTKKS